MKSARGLRDIIKAISPPWKREGFYEKLDYAMTVVMDGIIDRVDQAIAARVPTRTRTPTSLPLIGADRMIQQGPSEADASYGKRLQRAFDDWFHVGSARAVISQVFAFLDPVSPAVRAVTDAGVWDWVDEGGSATSIPQHLPPANTIPTDNWDWDGVTYWWRLWLIINNRNVASGVAWTQKADTWGSGKKWGDKSFSWGLSVPSSYASTLRLLAKQWKSANGWVRWILVNFNAANYIPTNASTPDGTWGDWSKTQIVDGVHKRVSSRDPDTRFINGVI